MRSDLDEVGLVNDATHADAALAELAALVRSLERAEARARDAADAVQPRPDDTAADGCAI